MGYLLIAVPVPLQMQFQCLPSFWGFSVLGHGVSAHSHSSTVQLPLQWHAAAAPGEKSSDPTRDWPRLACKCPGVSGGGVGWRCGSAVACCRVGGTECSSGGMGPLEGGHHYLHYLHHSFSQSVHLLTCVWLFATPWTAAPQASLSITNSRSLLKLMSIKSVMPSNHLILCHPFLLSPSIFPSIRVFSNESALRMSYPKYWSFSFNIFPTNTQDWSPLGWTVGSPCSPRDSQESSPTPQFKSINSSALSFLYSPTLTSKHDYWKNHSLD